MQKIEMTQERGSLQLEDLQSEIGSYPNPFNASTTISFSLPQASRISLVVYNAYGQRIKTLISNQEFSQGIHKVHWDGKNEHGENVASGIYLCRLTFENKVKLVRLMLIK
jgi:flagellar hook assembly protein FlgD